MHRTQDSDSRARSREIAKARYKSLLEENGGVLTEAEAATRLGSSLAEIRQRAIAGTVIAIPSEDGQFSYPAYQFSEQGLIDGVDEVLSRLSTNGHLPRTRFLLTHDADLGGLTRLEALADESLRPLVFRSADQFGEQGAS